VNLNAVEATARVEVVREDAEWSVREKGRRLAHGRAKRFRVCRARIAIFFPGMRPVGVSAPVFRPR